MKFFYRYKEREHMYNFLLIFTKKIANILSDQLYAYVLISQDNL